MTNRAKNLLSFSIIATAFLAMLAWTWNRWCDPIVDFGRELYVPWQIAQGKVLYRDLAYFNGPLSPYFNAMLFKLLGVSLRTLVFANIAIAGAVVWMIWKLAAAMTDRFVATAISIVFIALFMCLQLVPVANYNWITPYSHELTHGVALSIAGLLLLQRFIEKPSVVTAGLIGGCLGLVFLTKPEVFLAAFVAIGIGFFISTRSAKLISVFLGCLIAPIALAAISISPRGALGGWLYLFDPRLTQLQFYQKSLGVDQPLRNLILVLTQASIYALLLAPAIVVDRIAPRGKIRIVCAIGCALAVLAVAIWQFPPTRLNDPFRGLLIMMPILCVSAWRGGVMRFVIALFATLLLAKIALATRIFQYGFALAMPAVLIACAAALWNRNSITLRLTMCGLLVHLIGAHHAAYNQIFRDKPALVAAGTSDVFRADSDGELVTRVVAALADLPKDATVAVLPQGVMINYLSGRANPTPYFTLMPPEVLMFDDAKIAAAYQAHPPDAVVILTTDLAEYGYTSPDAYAPLTFMWLRQAYTPMLNPIVSGQKSATILRLLQSRN